MKARSESDSVRSAQYHISIEFGLPPNPLTGYGKENIGRNSKFLQGPMTEGYMVEEIVESLRHADPLFCKLQNHKPDGSVYQQCLCLTPVFNVDGERGKQTHITLSPLWVREARIHTMHVVHRSASKNSKLQYCSSCV